MSHEDTDVEFWINRRKRTLKENPMFYENSNDMIISESAIDNIIDYVYGNKNYVVKNNELAVLGELKLMQDRANKYFKD
jgi:hypothetical protein